MQHEELRSPPTADSSTVSVGGVPQATRLQAQDVYTQAFRPDHNECTVERGDEEDNVDDSEATMEELLILDQGMFSLPGAWNRAQDRDTGDSEMVGDEDDAGEEEDDDQEEVDWIEEEDVDGMDQGQEEFGEPVYGGIPMVLPRARFSGAANIQTIKDGGHSCHHRLARSWLLPILPVNFLGPNDELVASGSDDGNMFIWNKHTGRVHGIYEGDGSVVNVIEGHPSLPLVGVSGIDNTVKVNFDHHRISASSR
jgi:hypothetical protein